MSQHLTKLGYLTASTASWGLKTPLLCVMFAGIYLKLHGFGMIHFITFLGAVIATSVFPRIISSALPLTLILGLLFLQFVVTLDASKESAKLIIYSAANFFIMAVIFGLLFRLPRKKTREITLYLAAFMLVLGFTEIYLGARPLFDIITSIYTSDESNYTATARDISNYGALRARIFTSEPSSAGNMFGCLLLILTTCMRGLKRDWLIIFILTLAALFLIRSPTILSYAVLGLTIGSARYIGDRAAFALVLFTCAGVSIILPYLWFNSVEISSGITTFTNSGSFFIRQIAPIMTLQAEIGDHFWLGLGAEYAEKSVGATIATLSELHGGFYTKEYLAYMPSREFSSNALYELLLTYGFIGLITLISFMWWLLKLHGVARRRSVIVASLFLLTNHAGIVLAFTWIHFVCIAIGVDEAAKIRRLES